MEKIKVVLHVAETPVLEVIKGTKTIYSTVELDSFHYAVDKCKLLHHSHYVTRRASHVIKDLQLSIHVIEDSSARAIACTYVYYAI